MAIRYLKIVLLICVALQGLLYGIQNIANRNAPADVFNAAKTYGILGCGFAVVTWFGLFMVIGGAYFQMWQTEAGGGAWSGSFIYMGSSAFVMLFLNMKD